MSDDSGIRVNGHEVLNTIDEWSKRRLDQISRDTESAARTMSASGPSDPLTGVVEEPHAASRPSRTIADTWSPECDEPAEVPRGESAEDDKLVIGGGRQSRASCRSGKKHRLTKEEREKERQQKLGYAISLVSNQPELSNAEIARRVGIDKGTLYKPAWKDYQTVAERARGISAAQLPRGHVHHDEDGLRSVEGYRYADDV